MDEDFKKLVKSMTPHTRGLLIKHLERLRLDKLDTIEVSQDEVQLRRAQGAALAFKDLAKTFAE